jgi:hypothetical protein
MNNHILRSMSLDDARLSSSVAIECWTNNASNSIDSAMLIDLLHHQIENLADLPFEHGQWLVIRHHSGAVFPAIMPEGQRNQESWEGISMSACLCVLKALKDNNAYFCELHSQLSNALNIENLEEEPCLVA